MSDDLTAPSDIALEAERRYPGPSGTHYSSAAEMDWHADQLTRREGFIAGAQWAQEQASGPSSAWRES